MPADRSALGTLPASAHQYCDAVTRASGNGWYVFPLFDVDFLFDGKQVTFSLDGDAWEPLDSFQLTALETEWDERAPASAKGLIPPACSSLHVPGFVQMWSGFMARTAPDINCVVRPLTNIVNPQPIQIFEGMVATDLHGPWPIFANLRILETNTRIRIRRGYPLFQVQLAARELVGHTISTPSDNKPATTTATLLTQTMNDFIQFADRAKPSDITDPSGPEVGSYAKKARRSHKKSKEGV